MLTLMFKEKDHVFFFYKGTELIFVALVTDGIHFNFFGS